MPDTNNVPHILDLRPKLAALLPKNTRGLVLGGVAMVMVLIIFISGHNTPPPRKTLPPSLTTVTGPDQAEIKDYRAHVEAEAQKLAAEEAALEQTKGRLAAGGEAGIPHASPSASPAEPSPYISARDFEDLSLERERRKREYQSLFESNIALSYRAAPDKAEPAQVAKANGGGTTASSGPPMYRLFEGTVLETVLTNRLDSSFSGPVNCMVTTNVYSHDGLKLLIPQGTRALGEVRKLETMGDQRLAVAFHRLIMPDGFSLSLDQFQGLDQIGATGLRDEVNHHYLQIFGTSLAIGAFAGLAQANTRYGLDESSAQTYQQGVSASLSQSALHILDRYLNVLPTFTIREGYRVKVYLSQDLLLPAYEEHPTRNDL